MLSFPRNTSLVYKIRAWILSELLLANKLRLTPRSVSGPVLMNYPTESDSLLQFLAMAPLTQSLIFAAILYIVGLADIYMTASFLGKRAQNDLIRTHN